jgi:hypothetical protein
MPRVVPLPARPARRRRLRIGRARRLPVPFGPRRRRRAWAAALRRAAARLPRPHPAFWIGLACGIALGFLVHVPRAAGASPSLRPAAVVTAR